MNIDINQIETYTPTIYVNNSEPDLDETNLNHTEQALKRVTDAANAAILALKSLDSAKIDAAKIVNNLLATDASTVLSGPMGKALGDRLTAAENLLTQLNGDALIVAYPFNIDVDSAPGLSQNMIYFYQNHFYIGYSMTVSGKLYGAQLRFGHWLTRPEYRYNQGGSWTDWAAL